MATMNKENFYITRTSDGIRAQCYPGNRLPVEVEATARYAIHAFGFTIKMNEQISGAEYIARIKRNYSIDNKRIQACCDALEIAFGIKDIPPHKPRT